MLIILYILLMHRVGRCTDDQIYETKTVRVGDDVKLTCALKSSGTLYWIKLVPEKVPQVLARTYGIEDGPRITAKEEPGRFVLHIRKAELSDTGVYYCLQTPQQKLTFLKGTNLKVEGPEPYKYFTTVPPSDPVHPGDSVTLQCSVLSENKTCLEEHSVYWFSARLDKSQPSFIYTHGNSGNSLDTQSLQKCVYNFSRNASTSDAGTYYCAVTTCGEILNRNGTTLNTEAVNMWDLQKANIILCLLCAALALSLIVTAVLIYSIKKITKKSCDCCNVAGDLHINAAAGGVQQSWQTDEDSLVYSAPNFTSKKSCKSGTRNRKTAEEETIYTDVSALTLN